MTAEIPAELLDAIGSARACMADIRALAEKLGDLSPGQIEATLQGFLETGEDRALSRLLQVCAFNKVKLDPEVLCCCGQPRRKRCRSNARATPPLWRRI